ncbi:MAG TPA: SDR family oxidoreductase [Solirubrobacterales bacterium]|nr:SDR family oxidoreductase [Solirubrobacterales bacterium]
MHSKPITKGIEMKIVVIGGSGQLGSKIVATLQQHGHEVVPASPESGVNTITGEGLDEVLAGADAVVDAANAPAWEDDAVLEFFQTSSRNLTAAASRAGVKHYVAMSIVGADRLPDSGYLRAKVAQEDIVKGAGVPFTIVRATQFFEFIARIADSGATGSTVRLPSALFQPAAVAELGAAVAELAEAAPANGIVEVAGPEPLPMDETVARVLGASGDPRKVVGDTHAPYFGTELNTESLVPCEGAHLTPTHFADWLERQ